MYQRPIVEPWGWSEADWHSLTGQQQTRWWLENGWRGETPSAERTRKRLRKERRLYERGMISRYQLLSTIRDVLDEQCLREVLPGMPTEILAAIKEECDRSPALEDHQAWSKKQYGTAVNVGPDWTYDDFERLYWEFRSKAREFKRIIRNIFPPAC